MAYWYVATGTYWPSAEVKLCCVVRLPHNELLQKSSHCWVDPQECPIWSCQEVCKKKKEFLHVSHIAELFGIHFIMPQQKQLQYSTCGKRGIAETGVVTYSIRGNGAGYEFAIAFMEADGGNVEVEEEVCDHDGTFDCLICFL